MLSCLNFDWSIVTRPAAIFSTTVLSFLHGLYLAQINSILKSILTRFAAPAEERDLQGEMLPTPCSSVDVVSSEVLWRLKMKTVCCNVTKCEINLRVGILLKSIVHQMIFFHS